MVENIDKSRPSLPLPPQGPSSVKDRQIITPQGERHAVRIWTCQTTAAVYCMYFTGRIPIENMAGEIDQAVDTMLAFWRQPWEQGSVHDIGSSDLLRWLSVEKGIAYTSLLKQEGQYPPNWREQLRAWLDAGGIAEAAWGGHARALRQDPYSREYLIYDPFTGVGTPSQNLAELPDEATENSILIPPLPDEATPEMIELLRERVNRANAVKGNPRELLRIFSQIVVSSTAVLERDYLSRKAPQVVRVRNIPKTGLVRVVLPKKIGDDVLLIEPQRTTTIKIKPESTTKVLEIKPQQSPPTKKIRPSNPRIIKLT